ncbi:MAG TPA: hypothetical protein VFL93_08810 [Longimicrobiaceae bacterium]|nr:hypothetical protein [Longimicrobiaceae bacterium]
MSPDAHYPDAGPDPEISAALRAIEGDPPLAEVDWSALQRSISARAELELARRRSRRRARRWIAPLLPLAVAAGVAGVAWLGGGGHPGARPEQAGVAALPADPSVTPEQALATDLSDQDFRLLVSGRSDPDGLLLIAARQD